MSNDGLGDEWTIEVPESQRAFLQKLAQDVKRLSEQSRAIERHLRTAPSRNDVLPFLDQKVDITEVKELNYHLTKRLDDLYERQSKQKSSFSGQLLLQQQQLVTLQNSASVVTKFQAEYTELMGELQRLRQTAQETEAKAAQNLAEYKQEQNFIQKTFEKLSDGVGDVNGAIQRVKERQENVVLVATEAATELSSKYDQILRLSVDSAAELQSLSKQLPAAIENARISLRQDVDAAVTAEQQKRAAEQNHAAKVAAALQERLERLEKKIHDDSATLQRGLRSLEEKVCAALQEANKQAHEAAERQQNELQALSARLQQLVKEQQAQIAKLATFEASFGAADRQWKSAVQQVQEYTQSYVGRLETEINESREKIEKMLQDAAKAAENAKTLSQDIKSSWETDWKTREARVDEQLIQLKKLADEVSRGVEAETVCRDQAVRDLESRVNNVCAGLRAQCEQKADRDDVVKALWLKVDK